MELTNAQIFLARQSLPCLLTGQKIPVETSARLVRLMQELDIHCAVIEGTRQALLKQDFKEIEGKLNTEKGTPEFEAFTKDWADLMADKNEVKFDGKKIVLPYTVTIEPMNLLNLSMFIEMPE